MRDAANDCRRAFLSLGHPIAIVFCLSPVTEHPLNNATVTKRKKSNEAVTILSKKKQLLIDSDEIKKDKVQDLQRLLRTG